MIPLTPRPCALHPAPHAPPSHFYSLSHLLAHCPACRLPYPHSPVHVDTCTHTHSCFHCLSLSVYTHTCPPPMLYPHVSTTRRCGWCSLVVPPPSLLPLWWLRTMRPGSLPSHAPTSSWQTARNRPTRYVGWLVLVGVLCCVVLRMGRRVLVNGRQQATGRACGGPSGIVQSASVCK